MTSWDRYAWMHAWMDSNGLSTGSVAVLAVLLRYMDERGCAWPSISTIADKARCSETSARRYMREIVDAGWLQKSYRKGHSTVYIACVPEAFTTPSKFEGGTPSKSDQSPLVNLGEGTPSKFDTPSKFEGGTPSKSDQPPLPNLLGEYTKNRPKNIPVVESAAAGDDEKFDPNVFVMNLNDQHKLGLSISHCASIWSNSMVALEDSELVRQYLTYKFSDLSLIEPKPHPRMLHRWLCSDGSKWLDQHRSMSVGRNNYEPKPQQPTNYEQQPSDDNWLESLQAQEEQFLSWWSSLNDEARREFDENIGLNDPTQKQLLARMAPNAAKDHRMARRIKFYETQPLERTC